MNHGIGLNPTSESVYSASTLAQPTCHQLEQNNLIHTGVGGLRNTSLFMLPPSTQHNNALLDFLDS